MNTKRINTTSHNINVMIYPDRVHVDTGIVADDTIWQTVSKINLADGPEATELAVGRAVIEMINSRKASHHKCCLMVSENHPVLFDEVP